MKLPSWNQPALSDASISALICSDPSSSGICSSVALTSGGLPIGSLAMDMLPTRGRPDQRLAVISTWRRIDSSLLLPSKNATGAAQLEKVDETQRVDAGISRALYSYRLAPDFGSGAWPVSRGF